MKISVFYDHILQAEEQSGRPPSEILKTVKQAGIGAVEIRLAYLAEHEEAYELLRQSGLGISCIYEFYAMDRCDEREHVRKHIETAAAVGAKKILIVPGFLPEAEAEEMQRYMKRPEQLASFMDKNVSVQNMIGGLAYAVDIGTREGVAVTVEDFDGRTSPLSGMYGVLYILEHVPGLRFTLDTGNFAYSGEDVLAAWELLWDKIAHVHCKDRSAGISADKGMLSAAAGDGYIPIAVLVRKLKEIGYDDFFAIEHFDVPEQQNCMLRSAAFLKKAWEQIPENTERTMQEP